MCISLFRQTVENILNKHLDPIKKDIQCLKGDHDWVVISFNLDKGTTHLRCNFCKHNQTIGED